ncbi:VOC family protein [Roseinatronobacter sp. S2]|uniref:VOC family protein n=1 Tax=Roseinatronobacter sp. S2 TaxID=3035471 RepID=UPI00240FA79B|nr:VOC family protein [Roseinatronobacter sp. S2]WFE74000.1 VOC family protein [Roseinatronobacter sp. S2]
MTDLVTISLPVADRRRSHDFYRHALDLQTVGDLLEDDLPEPLQFCVNQGLRLMLVPDDGFGFVIAPRKPALGGPVECLLSISVQTQADVRALRDKWVAAGGSILSEPSQKPWGFNGVFADPDDHLWMILAAP